MSKFKVGDLVRGIDNDRYGITNKNSVCKVLYVGDARIHVKVIDTKEPLRQYYINQEYWVDPNQMELITPHDPIDNVIEKVMVLEKRFAKKQALSKM